MTSSNLHISADLAPKALFDLDSIQFVTAYLRRPGMSFTLIVRADKVMLINNNTFAVIHGNKVEMKQRVSQGKSIADLWIRLDPTPENFPMTHEWITLIDHIEVVEN